MKSYILVSVALVCGSSIIAATQAKKQHPYARIVLGGFVYGSVLTLVDMASGEVGKAVALLVTVSALLVNGNDLVKVTTKALGK